MPEHLRDVRERRHADAAADDQRAATRSRSKPLPSGPSTWRRSPAPSPQSVRVPGPIGSIRKQSSPACARQSDIGRGSTCPGGLEHEELAGDAGLDRAGLDAQERVRPDRLGARRPAAPAPRHAPVPIRSCSESAVSARAFAIACTAAAAPEIVVMQGTRALERSLADAVAVCAGAGALRRVDDQVAAAVADEVDDGLLVVVGVGDLRHLPHLEPGGAERRERCRRWR